jgi:hypothetical protein
MASFDTDLSACEYVIAERRACALFNTPSARFGMTWSPYGTYSKSQVDMRRKTEILAYANSASSSKTNNWTKNQKWSALINRSNTRYRMANCPGNKVDENQTAPTWTTACDVPGPPMVLQYDPIVPLYNYLGTLQQRTYSVLPEDNTPYKLYYRNEWTTTTTSGTTVNTTSTTMATLGAIVFTRYAAYDNFYRIPATQIPIGIKITYQWKQPLALASASATTPTVVTLPFSLTTITTTLWNLKSVRDMPSPLSMALSNVRIVQHGSTPATTSTTTASTTITAQCFLGMLYLPDMVMESAPNIMYEYLAQITTAQFIDVATYFSTFEYQWLPNYTPTTEFYSPYVTAVPSPVYSAPSFQLYDVAI